MIMNYSHLWEYDNVTFPPNFVMTYFHQVDKWRLGICWTVMMMMARMRLIMTIMTLIVMRTGRRMIIAMLATNPPLSPSSPCCWKRSLVASFQAVPLRLELRQRHPHVRLCKRRIGLFVATVVIFLLSILFTILAASILHPETFGM